MNDRPKYHPAEKYVACPACGAECRRGRVACWVCRALLPTDLEPAASPADSPAAKVWEDAPLVPANRFSFSIATLLLFMTIAAMLAGLAAVAPGLALFLAFFLAPICWKSIGVVRRKELAGQHVSTMEKAGLIGAGFLVAAVFVVLSMFAVFACLCGGILVTSNGPAGVGGSVGGGILILMLGLAAAAGAVILRRWVRKKSEAGELPL